MGVMREVQTRTRRIAIATLVLGIALFAAGCGKDGTIYGSLTWDYTAIGTIGGFPAGALAQNVEYEVSAGKFEVKYYIFDGSHYWPGGSVSPTYYWDVFYTVEAEKGTFPFIDGKDCAFGLYLSVGGVYKYGSVKSTQTPSQGSKAGIPAPAPQTWTQNGLIISVTNEAVKITSDVLPGLKNFGLKNK